MSDKETKIVEAAMEAISRYGIRRTTMSDIAEKAGISRQTLYTICSNKDEVLSKVIKFSANQTLTNIMAEWENDLTLAEVLDAYFEHAVITYYDMLQAMPDSNDLIADVGQINSEEIKHVENTKMEALALQLKPYAANLKSAGIDAKDLSEFIVRGSTNFKYAAEDRNHLDRLLGSLKASVLALAGELPKNKA